jgi:hypothetical protein
MSRSRSRRVAPRLRRRRWPPDHRRRVHQVHWHRQLLQLLPPAAAAAVGWRCQLPARASSWTPARNSCSASTSIRVRSGRHATKHRRMHALPAVPLHVRNPSAKRVVLAGIHDGWRCACCVTTWQGGSAAAPVPGAAKGKKLRLPRTRRSHQQCIRLRAASTRQTCGGTTEASEGRL